MISVTNKVSVEKNTVGAVPSPAEEKNQVKMTTFVLALTVSRKLQFL